MTHTFAFDYEIEALGPQSVSVEVTVTPASFPGDPGPDGESEVEVGNVTLNGRDVDTDGIKVCAMRTLYPPLSKPISIPTWFTLTELIREAADEQAEMETE